ncbi:hypothetical protein H351_30390 (plasmid) [Rhodococcus erythropolis R138]|nr:hypothetical protein H351_30390 [Rhodococcus erythropolis R138]
MKFRPTAHAARSLTALVESARATARFGGASTLSAVTRYRAGGCPLTRRPGSAAAACARSFIYSGATCGRCCDEPMALCELIAHT